MVVPTVTTRLLSGVWAGSGVASRKQSSNPTEAARRTSPGTVGLRPANSRFVCARNIGVSVINVVINPACVYDAGHGDAFAAGDAERARADGTADLRGATYVQLVAGSRMRQVAAHSEGRAATAQ